MGVLKTVFHFKDEKGIIIASTADDKVMADVKTFSGGNPFCVGQKIKLKFDDSILDYEVVNFEIYPYTHLLNGDGFELQGITHSFNCEIIIYIKKC